MSKVRLTGSNSGYVEIAAAADAGNLTFTMPTSGTALLSNSGNVFSGITTTGQLDINGSIDVSSTSVFNDDVTLTGGSYNVVWDKSDNQLEFGDNAKLSFGASSDMQLYHDGNHSYIDDAGTGNLRFRSGTLEIQNLAGNKTSAIFSSGGGQTLNFNNSTKFVTTNTGVNITGICTATSFSGSGANLTGISSPLSFRNMIINGAAMISQRIGTSTYNLTSSPAYYPVDRFKAWAVGGGTLTIQQSSDAPTGFQNSIMFTVNTADTDALSVGNTYYIMQQRIEGYNTRRLNMGQSNAQSSTLSFWVKSDVQGTYCVMLNNDAQNRCYMKEYTVSNTNTWEYKTITYPGDTSGTWLHESLSGVQLNWCLASGANYQGTANQWNTSWKDHTSNQVNFMQTSGNKIRFTGVQLEKGTTATEFEHRDFADELQRCKRYYQIVMQEGNGHERTGGLGGTPYSNGNSVYCPYTFPVQMRVKPTVESTASGSFRTRRGNSANFNGFSGFNDGNNHSGTFITVGNAGGGNVGEYIWIETNSGAKLALNAEL